MKNRIASMVFVLTLVLVAGAVFATAEATGTEAVDAALTVPVESQTKAPRTTVPACGGAAPFLVSTGLDVVIEKEEEPKGYCNCNVDDDCKSKCGDRGGSCLITIPCEDPERYVGWCYCGYGTVN